MNDLAREKLVEASLKGVRQIKGDYSDGQGGLCALGVLGFGEDSIKSRLLCAHLLAKWDIKSKAHDCPVCGLQLSEFTMTHHMNDDHDMSFLDIARKMPV